MRYYVDDKEVSECEFDSELRDAIYEEVSKNFDDYLDEEGTINVCGCDYYPSQLLKAVDETKYRCDLNDYADSVEDDYRYELDRFGSIEVNLTNFEVRDEDEEEPEDDTVEFAFKENFER